MYVCIIVRFYFIEGGLQTFTIFHVLCACDAVDKLNPASSLVQAVGLRWCDDVVEPGEVRIVGLHTRVPRVFCDAIIGRLC